MYSFRLTNVIAEDFVNYKKPAMFISTAFCEGKCENCQNERLRQFGRVKYVSDNILIRLYLHNTITEAIVFGGLEPFDQIDELDDFLSVFRHDYNRKDDVVIYTGYTYEEIQDKVERLTNKYDNIIIKFGRFIPNRPSKFDDVLGVRLASDNQWAKRFTLKC